MCSKICNACGVEKSLECFTVDSYRPKGRSDKCRECTKLKKPAMPFKKPLVGQSKVCRICNIEKDLSEFRERKGRKYTHEPRCIECTKKGLKIENEIFKEDKKRCATCQEYKYFNEYHNCASCYRGLYSSCKTCSQKASKIYRDSLPADVKKERKKQEYEKNKERYLRKSKEWTLNNKEKIKALSRLKSKTLKHDHPLRYIARNLNAVIRSSFNRRSEEGWCKGKRTLEILGCDIEFFRDYIESQFLNWMSWDNYGNHCTPLEYNCSWDLDHIIPVSYAKTKEDLYMLNHWSNYQPLCSKVNRYEKKNEVMAVCNIELGITT